mgnify:CR=1 FL=1
MGMDLEYGPAYGPAPAPQRPRLYRRIWAEMGRRVGETYRYDTAFWRTALSGLWVIGFLAFTISILGIPTGFGVATDILLAAGAGTIVLAIAGNVVGVLLALTGLRVPRLFAGFLLSDMGIILLILYYADLEIEAAAVIAVLVTLLGGLGGLTVGLLRSGKVARGVTGIILLVVLTLFPLTLVNGGQGNPLQQSVDTDVIPLSATDPGAPGDYSWHMFTYASGKDLHRTEYGADASLISSEVDASAYIKNWSELRTLFWGFGYKSLPLNAQVWMPEGEGPYPLVLMVHGNHMMEDYSEGGYAYLGELLASRGFIAVSLDENFLNYSAWSGIPDNDFKVRTWLILKHLEQIATFSKESGNPFYQKIDFAQTALLGHSRGGQAVAMAADAGRWFKSDPVLAATDAFHITSVIALAPTDTAIEGQQARLNDVNYLTLQGARDGDVHDFYGDRQYIRTAYSRNSEAFKSSLYIADANHSQFNSDWGLRDQVLPAGLLLNRSQIMDGKDQRQIAKVYVSAFLETTLHGKKEYQGLFQDYRSGLQWLPETTYYNRFQSGGFRSIVTFDEDRNKNTAGNGTAKATGLLWTEELAKDRESKSKATYGVMLERRAKESEDAFYRITLKTGVVTELSLAGAEGLSFSLANHDADEVEDSQEIPLSPDVEIELTDEQGNSARLPLNEVRQILPLPQTQFTWIPWLEERMNDGKYGDPSEAIFQTYELPFEEFQKEEPSLDSDKLTTITFYLNEKGDKIMLDDIGFYTGGTDGTETTTTLK